MSALAARAAQAKALGLRLYRTLNPRAADVERPLPPVRIDLRPAVPAWALNAAVAVLALAGAALLADRRVLWILAVAGAVALAVRPVPGLVQAYAVALGAGLLLADPGAGSLRVHLLILIVHLMVQLGSIAAGLHWSTQVEWAVLLVPARRFLPVQVLAQLLAVGAAWTAGRDVSAAWLSVAAGVALAALAWWLLGAAGPAEPDATDEPESD